MRVSGNSYRITTGGVRDSSGGGGGRGYYSQFLLLFGGVVLGLLIAGLSNQFVNSSSSSKHLLSYYTSAFGIGTSSTGGGTYRFSSSSSGGSNEQTSSLHALCAQYSLANQLAPTPTPLSSSLSRIPPRPRQCSATEAEQNAVRFAKALHEYPGEPAFRFMRCIAMATCCPRL